MCVLYQMLFDIITHDTWNCGYLYATIKAVYVS
jgi:hypothetical protein